MSTKVKCPSTADVPSAAVSSAATTTNATTTTTTVTTRAVNGFTFQQVPRSVNNNSGGANVLGEPMAQRQMRLPAYRDPRQSQQRSQNTPDQYGGRSHGLYGNIMYDRRVVRGSTYAPALPRNIISLSQRSEAQRMERDYELRRRSMAKKALQAAKIREALAEARRVGTPDPVDGRRHIEVQTQQYLEELRDENIGTTSGAHYGENLIQQEVQTDPMLDRPPTPLYVPFKTGRDADTQVLEGELFSFDTEVDPILDVIVGKTLEQAMLEVLQEEELEELRIQQQQFEQKRKEEMLETQRMEAQERRLYDEKDRRKRQEIERIQREKETRDKLQSVMYARSYLNNLENKVFAKLEDEGWFGDDVRREVELNFMPWLMNQATVELDKYRKARQMVDLLIKESVIGDNKNSGSSKDNNHDSEAED